MWQEDTHMINFPTLPKHYDAYEFRGVLTTEEVKHYFGINPNAVFGADQWLHIALRKDVGYKVICSDAFIGLTPVKYNDKANYNVVKHSWFVPCGDERSELVLDDDFHILRSHTYTSYGYFSSFVLY